MRAIQVSKYVDGPAALSVTTLPTPQPSPTHYQIKIHATGTNFFDLLQISGKYQHQPPLPWISGSEFAGTVLATPTTTPKGGHRFKVGDRVFGASQGAYATHILAPEATLFPIPKGWSFKDACGLYVTAPTGYGALIAKALGATVIATAGSERKRQVCLDYGADYVIDYRDSTWPQKVIALTQQHRQGNGKQGVDVVYDPVGLIDASIKCIAWNGRLVVIGFTGGSIEKVATNRVLLKNISILGLHWGMYASKEKETVPKVWNGIFDLINTGKFKSIVYTDKQYLGLEDVPKALIALGSRATWGKVVVELREDEGEEPKSKL
ncbi:hypothetical protein DV738_g1506, partial [Chaetothyriales sp. CBS 135597]